MKENQKLLTAKVAKENKGCKGFGAIELGTAEFLYLLLFRIFLITIQ